jgi:hypothetical protein
VAATTFQSRFLNQCLREKRPPRLYDEVTGAGAKILAHSIEHYRTLVGRLAHAAPGALLPERASKPKSRMPVARPQDIRHALRSSLRRPAFSLLVVLTRVVGVDADSAMFSIVNPVLIQRFLRDGAAREWAPRHCRRQSCGSIHGSLDRGVLRVAACR